VLSDKLSADQKRVLEGRFRTALAEIQSDAAGFEPPSSEKKQRRDSALKPTKLDFFRVQESPKRLLFSAIQRLSAHKDTTKTKADTAWRQQSESNECFFT
jgi:hypothetical protein